MIKMLLEMIQLKFLKPIIMPERTAPLWLRLVVLFTNAIVNGGHISQQDKMRNNAVLQASAIIAL